MRPCGVLLLVVVALSFAAEDAGRSPCLRPDGRVDERCERRLQELQRLRDAEEQCRRGSGVTKEEIRDFKCKIPTDPDVRERVEKYSLCSSLNLGQVLPDGALALPGVCQEAEAEADGASSTSARPRPRPRPRRPPPARCIWLRRAAACVREKEGQEVSSPEQRALAGRVCLCEAKQHAARVARCEAEEAQGEPRCAELRMRREGERRCRSDSGLSARQIKEGRCKLPDDREVEDKLAKYSMCSLLNNGQMLPNGTTKEMFATMNCSDTNLATTEVPERTRKRHERMDFICYVKKTFAACMKEQEAKRGAGQERRALAHQLCKCEAFAGYLRRQDRSSFLTTTSTPATAS